jgi:hypothetical protein
MDDRCHHAPALPLLAAIAAMIVFGLWTVDAWAQGGSAGRSASAAAQRSFEGTVTLAELDGTLVVNTASGESRIVYVEEATRITAGGRRIGYDGIKAGDRVRVRADGMRKALEVIRLGK